MSYAAARRPTPYELHVLEWKDCDRCELSLTRTKVVLWRGPRDHPWQLPCDVVFVGQAPGKSEDVIGEPFCGPAGNLFDGILARAVPAGVSYALTNMVACIPLDPDAPAGRRKDMEPADEHVKACAPRLQEFIRLADPKLIVTVGQCAAGWLHWSRKGRVKLHRDIPQVEVVHPSAILKGFMTQAAKEATIKRMRIVIADAIEEHVNAGDTNKERNSAATKRDESWRDIDIPF